MENIFNITVIFEDNGNDKKVEKEMFIYSLHGTIPGVEINAYELVVE